MVKATQHAGRLPSKEVERLAKVAAVNGTYHLTDHALERMDERNIIELEIKQVIKRGRHNPDRDRWDDDVGAWSYAIQGETINTPPRKLRVVVGFSEDGTVIVTVVDLSK